ncbi:MAG: hypothetical protein JJW01_02170 [Alphaproteobacteria bacterium]|nr:hypothetical protein [Rickettsiales bacterium]
MYGYQDKEHDIKIGVKSLAVLYGSEIKNRLKSFATTAFGCFIAAGILEKPRLGLGYYVFILLSYILLLKVITKTNLEEPKECYRALMTNTAIGFIIAFACYAGRAF